MRQQHFNAAATILTRLNKLSLIKDSVIFNNPALKWRQRKIGTTIRNICEYFLFIHVLELHVVLPCEVVC